MIAKYFLLLVTIQITNKMNLQYKLLHHRFGQNFLRDVRYCHPYGEFIFLSLSKGWQVYRANNIMIAVLWID